MEHAGPQPKHVVDDGAREEDTPGQLHVLEQGFIQAVQLVTLASELMWNISEADDAEALRSAYLEVRALAKAHCELFGEMQFPFDRFPVSFNPQMPQRHPDFESLEAPRLLEPVLAEPRRSTDARQIAIRA